MRLIPLLATAALLCGCAGATTGTEPSAQVEASTPSASTPGPSAPESSESEQPRECEQVMFQRAQNTIRSQQSAFAELDFAAARAYSSEGFRSGVSLPRFEAMIKGGYAFLLADPALEFLDCQRLGESALIRVEVAEPGSTITLVYRVVLENESWFIDAASISDRRTEVTA